LWFGVDLKAEPPAAGGHWGSGSKALSCRKLGFWGWSPAPGDFCNFWL